MDGIIIYICMTVCQQNRAYIDRLGGHTHTYVHAQYMSMYIKMYYIRTYTHVGWVWYIMGGGREGIQI